MRSLSRFLAVLTAFFVCSFALEITAPSSGSNIDPTQELVISWSISYSDPSTIDLKLTNSETNTETVIAGGVVTYTSSYTVPANTIKGSGSGYAIVAVGIGKTLGQVNGLSLGSTGGQTSTVAGVTFTSTQTVVPTAAASSTPADTDAKGSTVPTASIDSVGVTTLPGTVSGSEATSLSVTHSGSSFVTSTTSRTNSGLSDATASAGSTSTASGQKRLAGELVLGAAGVLAGIVALLA